MDMNKLNVFSEDNKKEIKRFRAETVKEFLALPVNEIIMINRCNCPCEILKCRDVYFGVKFYYKNNEYEIKDMESALHTLEVNRELIKIFKIDDARDIIGDFSPEKMYRFWHLSKDETFDLTLKLYRPFNSDGLNNNIICRLELYKEEEEEESYSPRAESRDYYFNVYADMMLPYLHLYYPQLDKDDTKVLDKVFQELVNTFNRKITFQMKGEPLYTVKPKKE